jgi:hypothetical protein
MTRPGHALLGEDPRYVQTLGIVLNRAGLDFLSGVISAGGRQVHRRDSSRGPGTQARRMRTVIDGTAALC